MGAAVLPVLWRFFILVPAADGPVDEKAHAGDGQRDGEGDEGELVVLHPQGVAADGGGDDGGDAPH